MKAVYRLERAIVKDVQDEKLQCFFDVTNNIPDAIDEFKEQTASYESQ